MTSAENIVRIALHAAAGFSTSLLLEHLYKEYKVKKNSERDKKNV